MSSSPPETHEVNSTWDTWGQVQQYLNVPGVFAMHKKSTEYLSPFTGQIEHFLYWPSTRTSSYLLTTHHTVQGKYQQLVWLTSGHASWYFSKLADICKTENHIISYHPCESTRPPDLVYKVCRILFLHISSCIYCSEELSLGYTCYWLVKVMKELTRKTWNIFLIFFSTFKQLKKPINKDNVLPSGVLPYRMFDCNILKEHVLLFMTINIYERKNYISRNKKYIWVQILYQRTNKMTEYK